MAGRVIKREQHLKGPEALHASTQVLWAPTLLTQLTALSLKLSPLACKTSTSGGRKTYDYFPVKIKAYQSIQSCYWFEGTH